jgi:hypothetical protein
MSIEAEYRLNKAIHIIFLAAGNVCHSHVIKVPSLVSSSINRFIAWYLVSYSPAPARRPKSTRSNPAMCDQQAKRAREKQTNGRRLKEEDKTLYIQSQMPSFFLPCPSVSGANPTPLSLDLSSKKRQGNFLSRPSASSVSSVNPSVFFRHCNAYLQDQGGRGNSQEP